MRQLPGDGVALPVGTLGGGGARPGAGGDSPLQIDQRALWFEPFLAELLIAGAGPVLSEYKGDMIVPVPLHSTKQREREFNQAERLADRLGAGTQIPVNKGLLRRVVATRTQALLKRLERLANVRNAFAMQIGRAHV